MVFSREGGVEKIFPPMTFQSLLDFSLATPFYRPYFSCLYYLGPEPLFIFPTYSTFNSTEVLDLISALRKT